MIKIKSLYKSFDDKKVLEGVDLTIETGDTVCIIGKSGCGKSVLIKNIVGLLEPDEGTIEIDGINVASLKQKQLFKLRDNFGFVFQSAALFDSLNVFENVVLRLYEHGNRDMEYLEKEAQRTLSSVGLLPDIKEKNSSAFTKEWNNLKEKKPSDLSGGMRKRVGVARALTGNPKYIFYDEPTTGLDPVTSEQIDLLIKDLTDTKTLTRRALLLVVF
jgi:phospholipid/cholesterol/gamma-HCH transport system ATP-binding protein